MSSSFSYGKYVHPDNEVNLTKYEVIGVRSRRNVQTHRLSRLHVYGKIKAEGAALKLRIGQLIAAYSNDNMGDAVYSVDGVKTHHWLTNTQSLTGVRVMHRSWPEGTAAELANVRSFHIVLESLHYQEAGNKPKWLWWQEVIRHVGTSGPLWEYRRTQEGNPRKKVIWPNSTMKIIQEGQSLGLDGYVMASVSPAFGEIIEHEEERITEPGSAVWQGNGFSNYPYKWRYVYESNIPASHAPDTH